MVPLCVAVLCSQAMFAQVPGRKVLGISEMFRLADENSRSIQTYKTGKEAADEALKAAKSQRLPDIEASLSFSYLGDGHLWDRHFKNGQNIPMPHFGNNFALEAQQVIYAGGAVNSGIALAELGRQMAVLDWQKNRQEIRFLLTGYYLDLYKLNNQLQVLRKNLDLTEQVIRNMEARRTQGTALKNDITRYELQKETLKLQLAQVEDARKIMNRQLVTTLHLPAGTEIIPDSALLDEEVKALAENDWQLLASQSNVGLQQARPGHCRLQCRKSPQSIRHQFQPGNQHTRDYPERPLLRKRTMDNYRSPGNPQRPDLSEYRAARFIPSLSRRTGIVGKEFPDHQTRTLLDDLRTRIPHPPARYPEYRHGAY